MAVKNLVIIVYTYYILNIFTVEGRNMDNTQGIMARIGTRTRELVKTIQALQKARYGHKDSFDEIIIKALESDKEILSYYRVAKSEIDAQ